MELREQVKGWQNLPEEEWKRSDSPVQRKQKLFERAEILILNDK